MTVEIPLREKYRQGHVGRHKSAASGNAGANKHRGETNPARKLAAQEQTRVNQRVLHLRDGRKRTWVLAGDTPAQT